MTSHNPPRRNTPPASNIDANTPQNKPETVTLSKQAVIDALMALEREEALSYFILSDCLDKIEEAQSLLRLSYETIRHIPAKRKLLSLFIPESDWHTFMTDQQLLAWEAEYDRQER